MNKRIKKKKEKSTSFVNGLFKRKRKGVCVCDYKIINNRQWLRISKEYRNFVMLYAYLKQPSKNNAVKHLMKRRYIKYVLKHHRDEIILSIRLTRLTCYDEFKNMDRMNKRIIANTSYGLSSSIYNFDI